jgi:sigma-B regulation protein RsbU (phosphoserine phosphatase)
MMIGNSHVDSSAIHAVPLVTPEALSPTVQSLLGGALRWLSRSLHLDQVLLFVRAGEYYELAYSSAGRQVSDCSLPADGSLDRLLSHTGPVPVEWLGGIAHILGGALDRDESSVLASAGADFLLGIPAGDDRNLSGFLCIRRKGGYRSLGTGDVRVLRAMVSHAALILENCRLSAALAAEDAELHRRDWEMEIARDMQNRIFPAERPRISGLDYYGDWRPARGLSGDYLDYFEMADGNLGLAIGDVAGKGLAAALLTSSLHSMARALRHAYGGSLADLVAAIDELFYEICPDNSYATLFVARYDPSRGLLHYVNAGHEPPLLLRKTGAQFRTVVLESSGPVIGMLRKSSYRENVVSLGPGDLLVAYTDGLCEAANARGEEWGFRRLLDTIQACRHQKARDIVDRVLESAEHFAAGCPQFDDMTLWLGRIEEANRDRPRTSAEGLSLQAVA